MLEPPFDRHTTVYELAVCAKNFGRRLRISIRMQTRSQKDTESPSHQPLGDSRANVRFEEVRLLPRDSGADWTVERGSVVLGRGLAIVFGVVSRRRGSCASG
jgi:hypothetical protein